MSTHGPKPGSPEAKAGGNAVKAKLGREHYVRIGKMGGATTAERGPDYFAEMGRKGGESTKARHGLEHFKEIGSQGGRVSRRTR